MIEYVSSGNYFFSHSDKYLECLKDAILLQNVDQVALMLQNFNNQLDHEACKACIFLDAYFKSEEPQRNTVILELLLRNFKLKEFLTDLFCYCPNTVEFQLIIAWYLDHHARDCTLRRDILEKVFELQNYDILKLCLKKNMQIDFDSENISRLINSNRADKCKLISLLISQNNDKLVDYCFTFLIENTSEVELLLNCGLSLAKVSMWHLSDLYQRAHANYRWLIDKLALQEPNFFKARGSELLELLLYSNRRAQDRNSWLWDLEQILAAGASPHKERCYNSPLEIAQRGNMVDACKLFVKHLGKDPKNRQLHAAVLSTDIKAIEQNMHQLHCKNACSQTPFDLLIEHNRLDLLPLFLPLCDFFTEQSLTEGKRFSHSPMHIAAAAGHQEMMYLLWHLGCSSLCTEDVRSFTSLWGRPIIEHLFEACEKDDLDSLKLALEKHPLLLYAYYKERSLLAKAVECCALKIVQFLVREKNFDVYGFKCVSIHKIESSPLYLALASGEHSISSCLLEGIADLPTFDEIRACHDKLDQHVYQTHTTYSTILYYLIKQRKEAALFLLAAHPKTASTIKREGLCSLLKFEWCDLNLIERLIEHGFDVNGYLAYGQAREIFSPLNMAISLNNLPLVRLLLSRGAVIEPRRSKDTMCLLPPMLQAATHRKVDSQMMLFLMGEYLKRGIPLPWDIILNKAASLNHEKRLFAQFLHYHTPLKAEISYVIKNFSDLVFDKKLLIAEAAPSLLLYGAKHLKTQEEWTLLCMQIRKLVEAINIKMGTLHLPELEPCSSFHETSKASQLLEQVFYHVLCGVNSKLQKGPQAIERISQMLLAHLYSLEDKLLLALQVGPSLSQIEGAMKCAVEISSGSSLPSASLFKVQIRDQESDEITNIKNTLDYIGVFRAREGLPHCLKAIKYQTRHPEVLSKALQALERIAIANLNKAFQKAQIRRIASLLSADLPPEVNARACLTIWALSPDKKDERIKDLFITSLEALDCSLPDQKNYALTLIELLGHFAYADSPIGNRTAELLKRLMTHPDVDIAFQATLSVSKTDHLAGLKSCLRVINTPVWQRYAFADGSHDKHVAGSFLMFRERPAALHDNRLAMQLRILDRIAHVHWQQADFQSAIDAILSAFRQDPSSNPELQEFSAKFEAIPKSCTRFVGLPLYLPEGSLVARGLSCRKGEEQFFESIRDLMRKGCGTTDLTLETAKVEGQTWSRIGHIFASHNSDLFAQSSPYFNGTNSAILLMEADFFNLSYMEGEARMESEHTLNMVWYNGIPKHHLQAIYLEETHRPDLLLLAGNQPLAQVKDMLTSPIFKDQTLKELVYLRRHLQAKELVCVHGEEKLLSLAERIFFYDARQEPALLLESIEKNLGRKFSTEEEVLNASLRRAAARQIVKRLYL